jgi:hypothetical protein
MNPKAGRSSLGWVAACLLPACLLPSCGVSPPRQDVFCELLSAEFRPGANPDEFQSRLRVQLSTPRPRLVCYPYADMAFSVRPKQKSCVIAIPRPRFRPPPPRGREHEAVVLTQSPVTVDIELSDWYALSLASGRPVKGTKIAFDVRYSTRKYSSNYVSAQGTIE